MWYRNRSSCHKEKVGMNEWKIHIVDWDNVVQAQLSLKDFSQIFQAPAWAPESDEESVDWALWNITEWVKNRINVLFYLSLDGDIRIEKIDKVYAPWEKIPFLQ